MSSETYPIKLSDFLVEHNCSHEFVENFDKEFDTEWALAVSAAIIKAFNWESTEQGHYFWDKLDNKWREIPHKENDMLWLLDTREK